MRYSYRGSVRYDDRRDDHVDLVVGKLTSLSPLELRGEGDQHTTGGFGGFDVAAMLMLLRIYPLATHKLILPYHDGEVDRAAVNTFIAWARATERGELVQLGRGTTGYYHNQLLLTEAVGGRALAFPYAEAAGVSVTAEFIQMARVRGIELDVSVLPG